MKVEEIKLLYAYNHWAGNRLLEACAKISAEQYVALHGYTSLRKLLVHMLDSMWVWHMVCTGQFSVAEWKELIEEDYPTLEVLLGQWRDKEQALNDYMATLSDDDLTSIVRYPIETGTIRERVLWHCLWHVVNHATQHRSEAALLLDGYGQSVGDMDFTVFLNQHFNLPA